MTEADIEIILERAKERYPGVRPRVISDNGPAVYREGLQGVYSALGYDARQDFTVLPSIERQNRTMAQITQRGVHSARDPLSLEDALRLVEGYVEHYNNVRLNSAIGYITPKDMLAGHQQEIQAERDRKLDAARGQRKNRRQRAA